MTTEQVWVVATGALALVALLALLVAVLASRSARRDRAAVDELAGRVARLESQATSPRTAATETAAPETETASSYVITGLEEAPPAPSAGPAPAAQRIDGRLFTDIVARETVVRAASWTHGVRRALAPESRNRIRFQVRQQAKQARRDRRTEVREALREYRARHAADEGDAA